MKWNYTSTAVLEIDALHLIFVNASCNLVENYFRPFVNLSGSQNLRQRNLCPSKLCYFSIVFWKQTNKPKKPTSKNWRLAWLLLHLYTEDPVRCLEGLMRSLISITDFKATSYNCLAWHNTLISINRRHSKNNWRLKPFTQKFPLSHPKESLRALRITKLLLPSHIQVSGCQSSFQYWLAASLLVNN